LTGWVIGAAGEKANDRALFDLNQDAMAVGEVYSETLPSVMTPA